MISIISTKIISLLKVNFGTYSFFQNNLWYSSSSHMWPQIHLSFYQMDRIMTNYIYNYFHNSSKKTTSINKEWLQLLNLFNIIINCYNNVHQYFIKLENVIQKIHKLDFTATES